jgi:hypothetical protein
MVDNKLGKDVFAERERVLEDEYFRQRDRELIRQRHDAARAEDERRRMGAAVGISDESLLGELQAIGYTPDTIQLLHLVPFIAVAWAEGGVSRAERDLILQAAALRGLVYDSPGHRQLESWLAEPPSERFLSGSFRAIRAIYAALSPPVQDRAGRTFLDYCTAVARATGGFYGLGPKMSRDEKEVIDRISEALTPAQQEAGRRAIEGS